MNIIEKTDHYILNTYTRYPIVIDYGKDVYVWDKAGKKYLDFLGGIACTPLGHGNTAITNAIIRQIHAFQHCSNLYYTEPAAALAELLVQQDAFSKVFFCNSGTEANEAAIKLARKYHWYAGRENQHVILSLTRSFHGRTFAALSATSKASIKIGFDPLPAGFKQMDWTHIDDFCAAIDNHVAAVILEPIQGEGGIHVAPEGFLRAVRAACDRVGALLIVDEIQCGIGRTGYLFAYQASGIQPDIMTIAKGFANGLPIGAVCVNEKAASGFKPGDHGSTFGGNPVSCSAALALLRTLLEENYLADIRQRSNFLYRKLQQLKEAHLEKIKEIRGAGFMLGIELTCDYSAQAILTHCMASGLLLNVVEENTLRLLPPYIVTQDHIEEACRILETAFFSLKSRKIIA